MKYWEMAVHRVSGPEILITMAKSSVIEQRVSRPKIFNLCDFVFYDCLENFWICNIYLMVDGFMFGKGIPRPNIQWQVRFKILKYDISCITFIYKYLKKLMNLKA